METEQKQNKIHIYIFSALLFASMIIGLILSFSSPAPDKSSSGTSFNLPGSRNAVQVISINGLIEYQQMVAYVLSELKYAKKSQNIKGVILKFNSGGGTVAASQEIYNQVLKFKKETNKPVIAVFGDIAASGAYYIACASDEIIARKGTLTGSIGVIMGGFTFKKLFDNIGIKQEIVKSGKFKDIGSAIGRDRTDDEIELLSGLVKDTFEQFFQAVLTGRKGKIDEKTLRKYADGRIFNGTNAKELGLVDLIGGPDEALQRIKELGNISGNLILYEREKSPFEKFFKMMKSEHKISISSFLQSYPKNMPLYLYYQ